MGAHVAVPLTANSNLTRFSLLAKFEPNHVQLPFSLRVSLLAVPFNETKACSQFPRLLLFTKGRLGQHLTVKEYRTGRPKTALVNWQTLQNRAYRDFYPL